MLNIVLVEPEIPQNTGNIARTCAATHSRLHLIEPLGFSISERAVKRAGLDYWSMVDITTYPSLDAFFQAHPDPDLWLATTKAPGTIPRPGSARTAGCSSARRPPDCPVTCGSGTTTGASVSPCGQTPAV